MSEQQNPTNNQMPTAIGEHAEQAHPYADVVDAGLERAEALGFDLEKALAANYGSEVSSSTIHERATTVRTATANIAEELQLDTAFFERPANTVLLASVADAWLSSEEKAANAPRHDRRIAAEREMLADIALMLGGEQSGVARSLIGVNEQAPRYVHAESKTADIEAERTEFFESIRDRELEASVQSMMQAEGEGSLLAKQRELLGVSAETEAPFEIRVIRVGERYELEEAGIVEKMQWPQWDTMPTSEEERKEWLAIMDDAEARSQKIKDQVEPYERALSIYKERFSEALGDIPGAWVSHEQDGSKVMYLRATDAAMLQAQRENGGFAGEPSAENRVAVAGARHEYAHTQKLLAFGSQLQLGILLEERKAEALSDDQLGYQDIKYLVRDLSMVHDEGMVPILKESMKEPDALSAFMTRAANTFGLRNILLLTANKPLPYDGDPTSRERFADLGPLVSIEDVSTHDAIIRENVTAKGAEKLRKNLAEWVGSVVAAKNITIVDFLRNQHIDYRERHGATHATPYIREAIDEAVRAAEAAQEK
jgi:hypothetical protein